MPASTLVNDSARPAPTPFLDAGKIDEMDLFCVGRPCFDTTEG